MSSSDQKKLKQHIDVLVAAGLITVPQEELEAFQKRLVDLGLFPTSECRKQTKQYVREHSAEFGVPVDTDDDFRCMALAQKFGPVSIKKGGQWIAKKAPETEKQRIPLQQTSVSSSASSSSSNSSQPIKKTEQKNQPKKPAQTQQKTTKPVQQKNTAPAWI